MAQLQREPDAPVAGQIVLIGVVGFILLVAIVIGAQALFLAVEQGEIEEKVYSTVPVEYRTLRDQQRARLSGPPMWENEAEGVVRIPIDDAMEITIRKRAAAGND